MYQLRLWSLDYPKGQRVVFTRSVRLLHLVGFSMSAVCMGRATGAAPISRRATALEKKAP